MLKANLEKCEHMKICSFLYGTNLNETEMSNKLLYNFI